MRGTILKYISFYFLCRATGCKGNESIKFQTSRDDASSTLLPCPILLHNPENGLIKGKISSEQKKSVSDYASLVHQTDCVSNFNL